MNPFEEMNLQRLKDSGVNTEPIKEQAMEEVRDESKKAAKLIVNALFDKHKGDAAKVKKELRADAELFKGLNLTQIINDTFKDIQAKRDRYKISRWSNGSTRKERPWLFTD